MQQRDCWCHQGVYKLYQLCVSLILTRNSGKFGLASNDINQFLTLAPVVKVHMSTYSRLQSTLIMCTDLARGQLRMRHIIRIRLIQSRGMNTAQLIRNQLSFVQLADLHFKISLMLENMFPDMSDNSTQYSQRKSESLVCLSEDAIKHYWERIPAHSNIFLLM